jgi:hypothetical protein
MSTRDEIERLRRTAAELVERAARRDAPLSPEEDAEIVSLLRQAQELEIRWTTRRSGRPIPKGPVPRA